MAVLLQGDANPGTATWSANQTVAAGSVQTDNVAAGNSNDTGMVSGNSTAALSGDVKVESGTGQTSSGAVNVSSGVATTVDSGVVDINSGNATAGDTGDVTVFSGDAAVGDSGDVVLAVGTAGGTPGDHKLIYANTEEAVLGGRLFSSVADSTVVTSIAAPTLADVSYTVPADTIKAGATLRVRAICRTVSVNDADTIQYTLRLTDINGAEVMVASTAINVGADNRVLLEGHTVFRAGPGAVVPASSFYFSSDLSVAAVTSGPGAGAVLTFDTTDAAGLMVEVLVPQSTNNAANQSVLESLVVDLF